MGFYVMRRLITVLTVVLVLSVVVGNAWGVQYAVTDLGTLGGTQSWAYGINNNGQIVGESTTSSGVFHAFRTAANQPIKASADDLGPTVGDLRRSSAKGINNSGQVVGYFVQTGSMDIPFRTATNQPINISTDNIGCTLGNAISIALGINDSGQVAGYVSVTDAPFHASQYAFRTAANQPINLTTDNLGTLGGTATYAWGINNSGQVVGHSATSSGAIHAFRTAANQPITAADDLGTLGERESRAYGINDSGQVVGSFSIGNDTAHMASHAFRTAANQPITAADDLGTLGGTQTVAYSINSSGQVVGHAQISGDTAYHAFLYSDNGPMQDLNNLIPPDYGWTLSEATGINDSGQICATGCNSSGERHAFLLTPVPECSTLTLLGIGSISLLCYAWRRAKRAV
jgi:probable HAF family extracellular repeat protein